MTTTSITVQSIFASATVSNFDEALIWYEKLMGRPADSKPIAGMAQWRNMGGAGLQVWKDDKRAGNGIITIVVRELEVELERLSRQGLQLAKKIEGDFGLVAQIFDGEGNRINLAEPPKPPAKN
ncbi:VOC family protein [Rhizobium sp. NLR9b]|uniref:VOC family protein n=1 Tax=unclassified Rhizobium TaxID=2613769 RepID=UPI001C839E51|nr:MULTISPECIES: VOC family protein [unclassified Rhizobium]MBX5228667.1 VOC family protein [Rhizobium sp. NLR9b]MBX5289474.1 VOC family protein [Rhizobium sp. NLR10b]